MGVLLKTSDIYIRIFARQAYKIDQYPTELARTDRLSDILDKKGLYRSLRGFSLSAKEPQEESFDLIQMLKEKPGLPFYNSGASKPFARRSLKLADLLILRLLNLADFQILRLQNCERAGLEVIIENAVYTILYICNEKTLCCTKKCTPEDLMQTLKQTNSYFLKCKKPRSAASAAPS